MPKDISGHDPLPDCPACGYDYPVRGGFRWDVLAYFLSVLGLMSYFLVSSSYRSMITESDEQMTAGHRSGLSRKKSAASMPHSSIHQNLIRSIEGHDGIDEKNDHVGAGDARQQAGSAPDRVGAGPFTGIGTACDGDAAADPDVREIRFWTCRWRRSAARDSS